MPDGDSRRLVLKVAIAITGASGGIYARRLLEVLDVEKMLLTIKPHRLSVL